MGRALPHDLRRVRREPARQGRRRVARRARGGRRVEDFQQLARRLADAAEAARGDPPRSPSSPPSIGNLRARALRARQRLAHDGDPRRARRAAPHADPARCSCTSSCAGTRSSTGRTSFYHYEQLGRDRRRGTWSTSCCSASNAIEFAIATNFVFETGFTNLQFVGLSALAHEVGDRMFEKMVGSIQSDEARHAQIGPPVLATVVEHDTAYAQYLLDKWFWRSWLLFAVVTGFAMDYLTPLEHRHAVVQRVHAGVGARSVPALARRATASSSPGTGTPSSSRSTTTTTWSTRARTPTAPRLVRLRRARARTSAPGCARSTRESWPELDPVWERVTERWRADRPRQRLRRPRHGHRRVLRPVPARAVRTARRAEHRATSSSTRAEATFSAPSPAGGSSSSEPERYARHKDVVKRVLAGEAPANLMALLRQYFGLTTTPGARTPSAATTRGCTGGRRVIPLYGFLEGDTIGLLVLADEDDTAADVARKLQASARACAWRRAPARALFTTAAARPAT